MQAFLLHQYVAAVISAALVSASNCDIGEETCLSDQSTLLQSVASVEEWQSRHRVDTVAATNTVELLQDEHEHRHVDFEAHPEIFKGCTHVFIDAGSNRGTHIRKLFEPEKYPKSKYLKLFDKGFGTPDWRRRSSKETGICAFGFEANPRWAPTLASISEAYEKQGWRAKWFVPVFVSNNSMRTEKLWINDAGQNSDWGASGTKTESTAVSTQVPDVDLSSFLDMLNRYVDVGGYRQMKMDIEGAEFAVLPLLLQKRMLCKSTLDVLTIEWHNHAPFISDAAEMQRASSIKKDVEAHGKCTGSTDTHILTLDDESYLADGQPLPTGRS